MTKSPVAVNYQVEGKSTIPSDGHLHKVSVAQLPFEAAIARVIVSRREVLAYLQVRGPPTGNNRRFVKTL